MEVISESGLALELFDPGLRRATNDFAKVLVAALEMGYGKVDPLHFLIPLAEVSGSLIDMAVSQRGLSGPVLAEACKHNFRRDAPEEPPISLTSTTVAPATCEMLVEAAKRSSESSQGMLIGERELLAAALRHLDPRVAEWLSEYGSIDVGEIAGLLEEMRPTEPEPIFDPDGSINERAFSPTAQRALERARAEAEGFGFPKVNSLVLLYAVASFEEGSLWRGLEAQLLDPKRLLIPIGRILKARARGTRSKLGLDREHLESAASQILLDAQQEARRANASLVNDAHIVCALVRSPFDTARRHLSEAKVALDNLVAYCREFHEEIEPSAKREYVSSVQEIQQWMRERVIGQDEAIGRVMPFIKRWRFGFPRAGRPAGVFLFAGKSGTGKTELAKTIASAIFGSGDGLLLLEMGQFHASESRTMLIGAPPGYVGYGEGKLTNWLRDHLRSVVVFDEVEKADTSVFDTVLRFLDEGLIQDPAGPTRDGTECIVVLTSNQRADELSEALVEQFGENSDAGQMRREIRATFLDAGFRPEFLNRVDEFIVFNPLGPDEYERIARQYVGRECARLRELKGIEVIVDDTIYQQMVRQAVEYDEGARTIIKAFTPLVLDPVIDLVSQQEDEWQPSLKVRVRWERSAVKVDLWRD